MKFYNNNKKYNFWNKISNNKLTAIYCDYYGVWVLKNGKHHNTKNAAYVNFRGYKEFILNGKLYGNHDNFNKKSWRRFVKMDVFL